MTRHIPAEYYYIHRWEEDTWTVCRNLKYAYILSILDICLPWRMYVCTSNNCIHMYAHAILKPGSAIPYFHNYYPWKNCPPHYIKGTQFPLQYDYSSMFSEHVVFLHTLHQVHMTYVHAATFLHYRDFMTRTMHGEYIWHSTLVHYSPKVEKESDLFV